MLFDKAKNLIPPQSKPIGFWLSTSIVSNGVSYSAVIQINQLLSSFIIVAVFGVPIISRELKYLTSPILGSFIVLVLTLKERLNVKELYSPFLENFGKPPPLKKF